MAIVGLLVLRTTSSQLVAWPLNLAAACENSIRRVRSAQRREQAGSCLAFCGSVFIQCFAFHQKGILTLPVPRRDVA